MTLEEILRVEADSEGWRTLPTGLLKIGKDCRLGKDVQFGQSVTIGDDVIIGDGSKFHGLVTLENEVEIGKNVALDFGVRVGECTEIGDNTYVGVSTKIRHDVRIKENVKIGMNARLSDYVEVLKGAVLGTCVQLCTGMIVGENVTFDRTPLQIQGPEYLVYPSAPGLLGIGCTIMAFKSWEVLYKKLAKEHDLNFEEYEPYARLVKAWMEENLPCT